MIIQIEPQSDIPIYMQLTNQIIEGIARGSLCQGDSLPSVRVFAADLGVNMHTVNKSYHELEKRGIIRIVPKSGAVIQSPVEIEKKSPHYERIQQEMKTVIAEAIVLGFKSEQIDELVASVTKELKGKRKLK